MNRTNGKGSGGSITIVGGGLAGLIAAIACGEGGSEVRLLEAHEELGGRARSKSGPYKANLGPHVIYKDGPFWGWLAERDLLPAYANPPLSGIRFRWQGKVRRTPPLGTVPSVLRLRGREAPVDVDFRSWVTGHSDERTAEMLSAAAGVYTFHHDPGALSAAFVWKHSVRVLLSPPPTARYLIGGWSALIASLEGRLRQLGVTIETGHRVDAIPDGPTIVATELEHARELTGENSLEVAERQHRVPGPRHRTATRRPFRRLRSRRGRLGRALQRPRSVACSQRRGAGAGTDAGAPRREHRPGGAAPRSTPRRLTAQLARA